MSEVDGLDAVSSTGWMRLGVGVAQGLAAGFLIEASKRPLNDGEAGLFAAAVLIVAFAPLILLAGLGRMRLGVLIGWTVVAALILGGLAAYDHWRDPLLAGGGVRKWPSPQLICFGAAGLYIAHHLVEPADVERSWRPSYQGRFDSAWRHGFQLALSLAFTAVFWGVLQLGAVLFGMIGIKVLSNLLREQWFICLVTAAVFAAAVHLTDVRPALIRGVRTVGMTLLSWLLPLMVGMTVLFLAALLFTGVRPLWSTRTAAAILLSAAAVLIVLANAAYQDGEEREALSPILRWAGRVAAVALVPLVALAAWATGLRIGQYGLTPERTASVAVVAVAALYALGYAWAAFGRGPWMRRLETVNIAAAVAVLVAILALFSPLADPARLSVADQVRRLEARATAPEKFDFDFLRFRAARFGHEALAELARSPRAEIADLARKAQAKRNRYDAPRGGVPFSNAEVLPMGAALPESFRRQTFTAGEAAGAGCLLGDEPCRLVALDVNGDGAPEVLAVEGGASSAEAFARGADGRWRRLGQFTVNYCDIADPAARKDFTERLARGELQTVEPHVKELEIGGVRLHFQPDRRCPREGGSKAAPAPPRGLGPAFKAR